MSGKSFEEMDAVEQEIALADIAFVASRLPEVSKQITDFARAAEAFAADAQERLVQAKLKAGGAPDVSSLFVKSESK